MDTNRISQFLGLTPKLANPIDNMPQKGGFADLLFGVMSNRIGTERPNTAGPLAKVSTFLPLGNDVATAVEPRPAASRPAASSSATSHPADDARERHTATGKRNNDGETASVSRRDAIKSDTAGTAASVAAKAAGSAKTCDGKPTTSEEIGGTGPTAEGAEIGDDAQDEVELQADAEGGNDQDSGAGQEGTGQEEADQSPDPQAEATVIDPQVAISDTPDPVGAIALPASVGIAAASAADDTVTPVSPGKDAQPDQKQSTATIPALAVGAEQALPVEAEAAASESTAEQIAGGQTTADSDPADVAAVAMARADAPLSDASLSDDADTAAQAAAIARQSERRAEDDGTGLFRRSAQAARQHASTTGSGAANASAQPTAPTANTAASATPGAAASAGTPAAILLPLTPLGFDSGLGGAPGLPGWTLNLAQGAAASRPDFVANLRQHLQNLPAHEQLALGIQRTARDGSGRITLQLSPSELGRIHVRLDIDDEKNVRASVSVERPGTLELLQRDTKALERALQDAGLKMDQGDLSFSLQGDDGESFAQEFGSGSDDLAQMMADAADSDLAADLAAQRSIVATGDGLVDVQI